MTPLRQPPGVSIAPFLTDETDADFGGGIPFHGEPGDDFGFRCAAVRGATPRGAECHKSAGSFPLSGSITTLSDCPS